VATDGADPDAFLDTGRGLDRKPLGGTKAYPVDRILEAGVINEQIGSESVLIRGDKSSGAARAENGWYRLMKRSDSKKATGETGGGTRHPGDLN
jgi:hypothetical protein